MPTGIGQRTMKVFTLVDSGENSSLPAFCDDGKYDCGFVLPAYADASDNDLRNDKYGHYLLGQSWTSSIAFVLQKWDGSSWQDEATMDDDTYGDYFAMGYFESKPKYSGIVIHWKEVLAAHGEGLYRIKTTETIPLGENITYSKSICLKEYSCMPNNSVRLEWWMNNGFGDINNDKRIVDFADCNLYYQVRIPNAFFGYPKDDYEEEEVQYPNGEFQDVTFKQSPRYVLKLNGYKGLPAWLHNIIKTYAIPSGTLLITDYSSNNPEEFIQKAVKRASSYEPRYTPYSKCAPVTVELKPRYNRLEKYRCISDDDSFTT